jgi:hypothetical protein
MLRFSRPLRWLKALMCKDRARRCGFSVAEVDMLCIADVHHGREHQTRCQHRRDSDINVSTETNAAGLETCGFSDAEVDLLCIAEIHETVDTTRYVQTAAAMTAGYTQKQMPRVP